MTTTAAEREHWQPDWSVPPGDVLQEALEERSMTQAELARRMGRPLKTINEIVKAKAAVTPDTAIQLERALGISAQFWNGLETNYRAQIARKEGDRVSWRGMSNGASASRSATFGSMISFAPGSPRARLLRICSSSSG